MNLTLLYSINFVFYLYIGADSVNFTVNENTGVISTNALLDRETQDLYSFTLTATDSGGRYSLTTVNLTVSDVNDNSPVCAESVYAGSVAESASEATSVISVACPDLDIGLNGEVCQRFIFLLFFTKKSQSVKQTVPREKVYSIVFI